MAKVRIKKRAKYPLTTMIPRLEQWLESSLGKEILASETEIIDSKLPDMFGYHLLQLSVSRQLELHQQSTIRHKFALTPLSSGAKEDFFLSGVASPESLPLESDAVDVVLMHHVLEYSQNPHQLLREAARVVVPRGHVVIVGFNPWSFTGLWSTLAKLSSKTVWHNRHMSTSTLYDWLSLLDFKLVSIDYGFYRPPIKRMGLFNQLSFLERVGDKLGLSTGGIYVMVAKKEVSTLTPIKPRWFRKPNILAGLEPSIYSHKISKKTTLH